MNGSSGEQPGIGLLAALVQYGTNASNRASKEKLSDTTLLRRQYRCNTFSESVQRKRLHRKEERALSCYERLSSFVLPFPDMFFRWNLLGELHVT